MIITEFLFVLILFVIYEYTKESRFLAEPPFFEPPANSNQIKSRPRFSVKHCNFVADFSTYPIFRSKIRIPLYLEYINV